jgi:hypothetical protein
MVIKGYYLLSQANDWFERVGRGASDPPVARGLYLQQACRDASAVENKRDSDVPRSVSRLTGP